MYTVEQAKTLVADLRETHSLIERAAYLVDTFGYAEHEAIMTTFRDLRAIAARRGAKRFPRKQSPTGISMAAIRILLVGMHRQLEDYTLTLYAHLAPHENGRPLDDFDERVQETMRDLMTSLSISLDDILDAPERGVIVENV